MSLFPRILAVGDAALTVELGDAIDREINARVQALGRSVALDPPPGVVEAVPTHRSLLVVYDPTLTDRRALKHDLLERVAGAAERPEPGALRVVSVLYGGDDGPDLGEVAAQARLTEAEAVRLHSGREYSAYMVGFSPGFAYLGDLDPRLATPRRRTPRVRVPRGSVAIAGRLTGIYPSSSAGGWSLIGRTNVSLFDPTGEPPGLILPGDRVRFQAVPELDEPAAEATTPLTEHPALEVLDGGLLTTVQDSGRFGHRRLGVAPMPLPTSAFAARW
ncbi:MAG: 5-oxoprolinase subunit PxpB, partial [Vicinamibacteria bacterium]